MGDETTRTESWADQVSAFISGLVRPAVTFVIVLVFAKLALNGTIGAEAAMGVISSVLTFWFAQRATTKATEAAVSAAAVSAAVAATRLAPPPPPPPPPTP